MLKKLGMLSGDPMVPPYQVRVEKSTWVRAQVGGILRFHVTPGQAVEVDQPIATNASVFGQEQNILTSPVNGIVLGMTTLPMVKPGEPVCHIAIPNAKSLRSLREALATSSPKGLHRRIRRHLATNISVSELEGDWASTIESEDNA